MVITIEIAQNLTRTNTQLPSNLEHLINYQIWKKKNSYNSTFSTFIKTTLNCKSLSLPDLTQPRRGTDQNDSPARMFLLENKHLFVTLAL